MGLVVLSTNAPLAVMVGIVPVAPAFTVTAEDVALLPEVFVTLTVYEPDWVTTTELVVCPPGLHKYAEPEFAVSVTLPPAQKVVGPLAEIVAIADTVFGSSVYVNQ